MLVLALLRALEEADAPAPFLPSGDTLSPRDLFVAEVTCIWFVLELVCTPLRMRVEVVVVMVIYA